MKISHVCIAVLLFGGVVRAEHLVPSALDAEHAEAREKAFIPWSTSEESGNYWHKLASSNIPVYNERKSGGLDRDIYVPNPGIGYWVLGGLSEEQLWKTQREKLKIGDELVSATAYKNENGILEYWALWAPRNKSYFLKDKMRELGITPAKAEFNVEISLLDLPVKDYKVGFADLWIGKNVDNRTVLLHGKPCEDYLFAHAPSRVVYSIPAGVESFSAWGIRPDGDGNVVGSWFYIVNIDGKEVFRSKPLEEYPTLEVLIEVPVPPVSKEMELIVDPMKNGFADHSIWAEPTFKWPARRVPNPRAEAAVGDGN